MSHDNPIYVLDKRLILHQPPRGFKTSIDAVLLAAACPATSGAHVLDMGCGVGSAGLCVLARVPETHLTGVELQDDHAALAAYNAKDNGFETRCDVITCDIRNYKGEKADHVVCNPPYFHDGDHVKSPSEAKALAMGADVNLEDWVACAFDHISGQGSLTLVHRADQLDKILQTLGKRFGATEIIPLWPKAGTAAKRVILRSYKHKKSPMTLHAGLTLHKADGAYTDEAEKILRGGDPLL